MPKAIKSPEQWYARARQFQELADRMDIPMRLDVRECDFDFAERMAVYQLVRRRLLAESKKCWANGGRRQLEKEGFIKSRSKV